MLKIAEIEKLKNHLLGIRTERESAWVELSKWISGTRGVFNSVNTDQNRRENMTLFRSITSQALDRAASGITSGMTPRNISWFKPTFIEAEMEELTGARQWLDQLDIRMKDCLANGGFYQAIQTFNEDLLWSGCALIYCEKAENQILRFYTQQIGTFCVAFDDNSQLCAVLRQLSMTPKQMQERFGEEKLPQAVKKKIESQPYEAQFVWHMAIKNKGEGRPNKKFTVDSYYWMSGEEEYLRTSGYHEMPFFFAVWHETENPYGMGPGDEVLADCKQLDIMERRKLEGLSKLVNPPVAVNASMKEQLDLSPGAINYVTTSETITPILDLAPYAHAMQYLQAEIDKVAQRVEHGLMSTIFASIPLDQRPRDMSATEFLERKREALQQLGPVISAYEPNVLTPLLYRVAQTLDRENLTPIIPESLSQYPLFMKMEFISPMANALRQSGAEAARALVGDVTMIAQNIQNPAILDKIDFDQAVDELAKGIGAPASIIRSDEDTEAIRQQRQAQEQQMMQMQEIQAGLSMTQQAQDIAANDQMLREQQGM